MKLTGIHLFKTDMDNSPISSEDAEETFRDLLECDLAKLPYMPCAINDASFPEMTVIVDRFDVSKQSYINALNDDTSFFVNSIDYRIVTKRTGLCSREQFVVEMRHLMKTHGFKMMTEKELDNLCWVQAAWLCTVLISKGVKKDTRKNKLASLGIGKSKNRIFSHTTVITIPTYSETNNGLPTGRHVRAHWRRGHVRNQHHGPGNRLVKKIFVQPSFVNADGEYLEREAYRVRGHNAPLN